MECLLQKCYKKIDPISTRKINGTHINDIMTGLTIDKKQSTSYCASIHISHLSSPQKGGFNSSFH
ncbi:hypothetical protein WN48_11249 [Eufriesea mexicana]|uniref:Uncharacterized protein n=1 Tax=Eufriesea mexicana TaxID=516756 RepID=A0A310SCB0_9HYME|nr:hypothetical protein WN48_11249 [Eufriesea mexicana]